MPSATDKEAIKPTPQNLEYPKHFIRINTVDNHTVYNDRKITAHIREMVEWLKSLSDRYTLADSLGGVLIVVTTNPAHDEFDVYVAENFYKTSFCLENNNVENESELDG